MKEPITTLFLVAITLASASAEPLPRAAQDLLSKRQDAIARIDDKLNDALQKVKLSCMKENDLEGANAVDALIKDSEKLPTTDDKDPLVGTVWNFLGVNRQKINEFVFLAGGKVRCESSYKDATWRRLDEDNILFGYGTDKSFIVFRVTDAERKNMAGHHYSGRSRSIQRIK